LVACVAFAGVPSTPIKGSALLQQRALTNAVAPAPQLTAIVSTQPPAQPIFESQDLITWRALTNSPASVVATGNAFFRAGATLQLSWHGTTNAVGFTVLEWWDDQPGWLTIPVTATNCCTAPAMSVGTNHFVVEEVDGWAISGFSNHAAAVPVAPTVSLILTNAP